MTPERWRQIEQLYDDARQLAATERATFKTRAPGGDQDFACATYTGREPIAAIHTRSQSSLGAQPLCPPCLARAASNRRKSPQPDARPTTSWPCPARPTAATRDRWPVWRLRSRPTAAGRCISARLQNRFRFLALQTESARAYDAAVDHEVVKVEFGEDFFAGLRYCLLVLFANGYFMPLQRGFDAVDEAHAIRMRAVIRSFDHFADRAARAQHIAARRSDFDARHDLRADRQEEMNLGK